MGWAMTFIGYIEADTDRAILFQDHYWASHDWFPKSQVEIIRYVDTHEVQIVASAWICGKKEGLAEFAHREPVPEWPPVDSKQNVDLPY